MNRSIRTAGCLMIILALAGPWASGQDKPAALRNPREYTAHLVGHAHIDLSWLWRWEETLNDVAVQTFKGTLAQMAKMPGLTFAQSQAAVYEAMERSYPALFEEIRAKIREGTWFPVGGMWAEPDLNMPDGEALARQLLYGKRYFLDKFGVDVTVGWNPDSFGHNAQLPQILRRAGIRSYVFERCAPDKTPFFWWEGKDGSRVLAHVPQGWYLVDLKDGLNGVLKDAAGQTAVKDFLILYGAGDHGGGPRDSDVAAIRKYKDDPGQPRMVFSGPASYFKKVEASAVDFPVVRRELNFTFPACYTTQAATKKWNRTSESLLLQAERFSALAVTAGYRDYYPERDIDEAWKTVLRNQFHDILDGSSIGPVYDEAGRSYREAAGRGERALAFSLETILNAADTTGPGQAVAVFNPLFWPRTDPVEAEVALPGAAASLDIAGPGGSPVPFQVLEKKPEPDRTRFRVLFLAADVPAFGFQIYHAVAGGGPGLKPAAASPLAVSPGGLENAFLRIVVDSKTGWITSLFDKRSNREVLAGPANVLQAIADEPESMSAWELGLKGTPEDLGARSASVEVIEKGPVRAVLRVKTPFASSFFIQDLILYAGLARLDVRMTADWQERNVMIKVAFPVRAASPQAEFEIPFGTIARPADGAEVPALRWVDVSDANGGGLSLLDDSKYGFDVKGSTLRMSVVHGPTYPDPEADRGRHELRYALVPHAGSWKDADTLRRGAEFNNALIVRTVMSHKGALPKEVSFVRAEPSSVVLSALKMESGYNSRAMIVRMYEAFGRRSEARVSFPWPVRAEETDLIERPVPGGLVVESAGPRNEIVVPVGAFEIKTLRVTRKQ